MPGLIYQPPLSVSGWRAGPKIPIPIERVGLEGLMANIPTPIELVWLQGLMAKIPIPIERVGLQGLMANISTTTACLVEMPGLIYPPPLSESGWKPGLIYPLRLRVWLAWWCSGNSNTLAALIICSLYKFTFGGFPWLRSFLENLVDEQYQPPISPCVIMAI